MASSHSQNRSTVCYRFRPSVFCFFLPDPLCYMPQGYSLYTSVELGKVCSSSPWNYCRVQSLTVHTSTIVLPLHEDQPQSDSLFATRTLPPLRPHPHPRPQPYPLLQPLEWFSSSYQQDDDGHLRCFNPQGNSRPLYQILPSPLATSSSEDSQNQEQVVLRSPHVL